MANQWVSKGSLKGPAGPQGPAGVNGRGIQTSDINTGGHLIVTYTDQTQVDLGDVTGEDGSSVQIAGTVPTYADLPTGLTAADAGSGYLVDADGLLYVWDGTQFPADGAGAEFRGPQGPQGIQGVPGTRGSKWTVSTSDPTTIPADAIATDLHLNTTTGEVFQIQDVA